MNTYTYEEATLVQKPQFQNGDRCVKTKILLG